MVSSAVSGGVVESVWMMVSGLGGKMALTGAVRTKAGGNRLTAGSGIANRVLSPVPGFDSGRVMGGVQG
ncbi:MAG: hypothetical protein ACP5JB_05275 [candidate division WOR-3 bacterium]